MIIARVVVGADLLHVLLLAVEEDIGEKGEDDELEQVQGEAKVGPVVAVLEDVEDVTIEVDLAVDVHFGKGLDGDLGAARPLGLVGSILEGDVGLDRAAGELGVFVDAGAEGGLETPVGNQDREEGENAEEDFGLEAATNQTREEPGDTDEETAEDEIGEAVVARTFGGQGRVVDGGRLLKS